MVVIPTPKEEELTTETQSDGNQNGSRPSHTVWFVPEGDDPFWTPIGAQWSTRNGTGFRQVLNFLPVEKGHIVVLPYKAKGDDVSRGGA